MRAALPRPQFIRRLWARAIPPTASPPPPRRVCARARRARVARAAHPDAAPIRRTPSWRCAGHKKQACSKRKCLQLTPCKTKKLEHPDGALVAKRAKLAHGLGGGKGGGGGKATVLGAPYTILPSGTSPSIFTDLMAFAEGVDAYCTPRAEEPADAYPPLAPAVGLMCERFDLIDGLDDDVVVQACATGAAVGAARFPNALALPSEFSSAGAGAGAGADDFDGFVTSSADEFSADDERSFAASEAVCLGPAAVPCIASASTHVVFAAFAKALSSDSAAVAAVAKKTQVAKAAKAAKAQQPARVAAPPPPWAVVAADGAATAVLAGVVDKRQLEWQWLSLDNLEVRARASPPPRRCPAPRAPPPRRCRAPRASRPRAISGLARTLTPVSRPSRAAAPARAQAEFVSMNDILAERPDQLIEC